MIRSKNVLVLIAHPSPASYGTALAEAYLDAARAAGHEAKAIRLPELRFDPVLHAGYAARQELEPDLQAAQDAIRRADHLAFVYPIWWGGLPALMKGFLDRVFLPGFAFQYQPGKSWPLQLLKGKSAHLVVTMDTPPWYFRWFFRAPGVQQMKRTTLEFCGIRPVRTLALGPIQDSKPQQRESWLAQCRRLAATI